MDSKLALTQKLERSLPLVLSLDPTFDIGQTGPTPVDDCDYKVPSPFTGKINKVTIALCRHPRRAERELTRATREKAEGRATLGPRAG